MKITVGLDLRPSSQGALHFARWLAENGHIPDGSVDVLHFLEQEHLALVLRYHHLDEVVAGARATAAALLAQAGAATLLPQLQVLVGTRAEVDLDAAARGHPDGLLVIGRLAQRGEHRPVRLGKVARALLRAPPQPTVVVPPDLTASDLGAGPIVGLSDLRDGSLQACKFAASLADRLGRALEVVHVMADPLDVAPYGLVGAVLERPFAEERRLREEELAQWTRQHRLEPRATTVLVGEVVGQASAHAEKVGAPLLVAGFRQVAGVERFVLASLGRELAARATVPVAVVPG